MKPSDVYDAAADYIEKNGWRRGNFGEDGGPRCMFGAIRSVTSWWNWSKYDLTRDSMTQFNLMRDSITQFNDLYTPDGEAACMTLRALAAEAREAGL